jgi:hypothetical protein
MRLEPCAGTTRTHGSEGAPHTAMCRGYPAGADRETSAPPGAGLVALKREPGAASAGQTGGASPRGEAA